MRNISLWIMIIIIFIISVFCGYFVAKNMKLSEVLEKNNIYSDNIDELDNKNKKGNEIEKGNLTKAVDAEEGKIGINTDVKIITKYRMCNHVKEESPDINEVINLTEQGIKKRYPDYDIKKFTKEKVELEKEEEGICDEHYIVTQRDNWVIIKKKIYNQVTKDIRTREYQTTDISVDLLPEEDVQAIKRGIEIEGIDNLNKFLEDYE